jgi:hypothetical protein
MGCFGLGKISGAKGMRAQKGLGTPGESFDSKVVDILRICRIFNGLISFY